MAMPVEVRAEMVYGYLKDHVRKHLSKRDLSNATGLSVNEITTDVLKKVRQLARADGLFIPSAIGSGMYILTDNGQDVLEPTFSIKAQINSGTLSLEEHVTELQERSKDFPPKERAVIKNFIEAEKAAIAMALTQYKSAKEHIKTIEEARRVTRQNKQLRKANTALKVLAELPKDTE